MTHELNPAAEEALAKILHDASGFDLRELDRRASFAELGFDSLFLIQFTQKIKNKLRVKVTFRQLIEELPTLDALIQFVGSHTAASALGASTAATTTVVVAASADQATPAAEPTPTPVALMPTVAASARVPPSEPVPTNTAVVPPSCRSNTAAARRAAANCCSAVCLCDLGTATSEELRDRWLWNRSSRSRIS
ncbi:MAG: acyl carrier protein [Pirellulaceae bacterium]